MQLYKNKIAVLEDRVDIKSDEETILLTLRNALEFKDGNLDIIFGKKKDFSRVSKNGVYEIPLLVSDNEQENFLKMMKHLINGDFAIFLAREKNHEFPFLYFFLPEKERTFLTDKYHLTKIETIQKRAPLRDVKKVFECLYSYT